MTTLIESEQSRRGSLPTMKKSSKNYLKIKILEHLADEIEVWHYMKIIMTDGLEIKLKSDELEPLKSLAENIKDAKQQLENLGLPLTIETHNKPNISLLASNNEKEISMRGMVNLMILLLLCYHIIVIVQSLQEHNFVLSKEISAFWQSGILFDIRNYTTGVAIIGLSIFLAAGFFIEKVAAKNLSDRKVSNSLTMYVAIPDGSK